MKYVAGYQIAYSSAHVRGLSTQHEAFAFQNCIPCAWKPWKWCSMVSLVQHQLKSSLNATQSFQLLQKVLCWIWNTLHNLINYATKNWFSLNLKQTAFMRVNCSTQGYQVSKLLILLQRVDNHWWNCKNISLQQGNKWRGRRQQIFNTLWNHCTH